VGPPKWLGVTSANDPNLTGAVFALTSAFVFLGTELNVYGVINTEGLQLTVADSSTDSSVPGTSFSISEALSIIINSSNIVTSTTFKYTFSLDLPDIELAGISLGSFDGTMVELNDALGLTVDYGESDWKTDGIDFYVMVSVIPYYFRVLCLLSRRSIRRS